MSTHHPSPFGFPVGPGGPVVDVLASPPPGRRLVLAGIVTLVLGIGISVVGFGVVMFELVRGATDAGASDGAIVEVTVPGEGSVDLDAGTYDVLALGTGLVNAQYSQIRDMVDAQRTGFVDPVVTIRGPDGRTLSSRPPRVMTLEDRPGTDVATLWSFRVDAAGVHTIEVSSAVGSGSDPVRSVIVRSADGLQAFGIYGRYALGLGLILVGGVLTAVAVPLLVIGIVIRARGRTAGTANFPL